MRAETKKITIAVGYLHSVLHYDTETGNLYWKERPDISPNVRSRLKGKVAGHVCPTDGYVHIRLDDQLILAHRIAWAMYYGEWPVEEIDHENGVRNDNRIGNLRSVTKSENMKNAKIRENNTSGVTGVHFHSKAGKWQAGVRSEGKFHYLGLFESFEEAVRVRKQAEFEHGFHPNHGRPA